MADEKPLTDTEVHDRLVVAAQALGDAPGSTTHGDTAIQAARRALAMLQVGLVVVMEDLDPTDGSMRPGS